MKEPTQVILKPIITEKSMLVKEQGKYLFAVDPRATKVEIAQAIEKLFSVSVEAVNTVQVRGKKRQLRGFRGSTSSFKKAYITLTKGSHIEELEVK